MAVSTSTVARSLISLVLAAALLYGGYWCFQRLASMKEGPKAEGRAPPRATVRVLKAVRGPHQERLVAYGRASALRWTTVSAELAGLVTKVSDAVRSGKSVKAGDELVWLDPSDQKQAVASATAQLDRHGAAKKRAASSLKSMGERLESAQDELEAARSELERLRGLAKSGSTSVSEVDTQVMLVARILRVVLELEQAERSTTQEIAQAEADIKVAQAALDKATKDEKRTLITAPYDGVITSRGVEKGTRVAPGVALLEIIDPDAVEIGIMLGASHFDDVHVDSRVELRYRDGGPLLHSGQVARISPVVDMEDRTFTAWVEVRVKEDGVRIPPGAFLVATVDARLFNEVVAVPRTAFVEDRIFVAERVEKESSEATVRGLVPVLRALLPEVALVDAGIVPGDEIIVTNLDQVADDARIRVAGTLASVKPTNGDPPGEGDGR